MPCEAAVLILTVGYDRIGAHAPPVIQPAYLAAALRLQLLLPGVEHLVDRRDWVGGLVEEEELL